MPDSMKLLMDDGALVLHLPLQLERPLEQALHFGSICKETGIYGITCASINLFLPSEKLQSNMLPPKVIGSRFRVQGSKVIVY
jgi:hypothetical protein